MNGSTGTGWGRRGRPWRPLFCLPALLLLAALQSADGVRAQEAEAVRILRRQVRVARESDGGYRVIEALDIEDSRASGDTVPRRLAIISAGVEDAQTLAGDVSPTRLVFDANHLVLLGGPPAPQYRLLFTYRLAPNAEVLVLEATSAVNELLLDVDRGSVDAAPEPPLSALDDGGTPSRPSRRYTARDLPPHGAVRLRLIRRQTEWRERLAVLLAVGAAAGLTGIRVWRGGRADRRQATRMKGTSAGSGLAGGAGHL